MPTTDPGQPWKSWQKIAFRFFFLFLGFYLLNYETAMLFLNMNKFHTIAKIYGSIAPFLHWLDANFYHTGYNPQLHRNMPGDNRFGMVFYFTAMIIFIIVVIVWSIRDRQKKNYNKLNYWFRLYVRYMVA